MRTKQEAGPALARVIVDWTGYGARLRAAWGVLRGLPARPHGLRVQLAAMVLIALLPAVFAQAIGAVRVSRDFHRAQAGALAGLAQAMAATIDRELLLVDTIARKLAEPEDSGAAMTPDALQRRAHAEVAAVGAAALLWRADGTPEPGVLLARYPDLVDTASAGRARDLAASRAIPRGSRQWRGTDREMFIPVIRGGTVAGVLEVSVTPERITEVLSVPLRGERASAVLVDGAGNVIGRSVPSLGALAAEPAAWPWREAASRPSGTLEADGTLTGAFATPAIAPTWRVIIVAEPDRYPELLRWPLGIISIATAVSILLGTTVAFWLGAGIVRPLRQLTSAAQAVAAGSESLAEVPNSLVREFNDLRNGVARADAVLRRRAAAERLALREARTGHELLASVVNATADLIYVKDLDLRFVLVNQAALRAEIIGREEWQVLGKTSREINPGFAERSERLEREVLATGETRRARFQWPRADGTPGSFILTETPWCNVHGQMAGVVTVAHDFTDQVRAEQRLAAVQGELLRATRLSAMGAMASGLAHELNQPLAAATNFLNATVRMLAHDPMEASQLRLIRKAVTDAVEQTLRAGQIVRRLRVFIGRGESDMRIENVGDIIGEIQRVACADGAIDDQLIVIVPGDATVQALVERTQIQQVLLNLIKNASEAIGEAQGGCIKLAWRAVAGGVEITVADNGPGIAPDIRGRLFQPFTSTKANGMGIGLAICRTIVEGHGGTLVAEDRDTGGVLFRITLPPVTSDTDHDTGMEAA